MFIFSYLWCLILSTPSIRKKADEDQRRFGVFKLIYKYYDFIYGQFDLFIENTTLIERYARTASLFFFLFTAWLVGLSVNPVISMSGAIFYELYYKFRLKKVMERIYSQTNISNPTKEQSNLVTDPVPPPEQL